MSFTTPSRIRIICLEIVLPFLLLTSSLQPNGGGGAAAAELEVADAPGMVRRPGNTLEDCAKACLDEKTIQCRYFKLVAVARTCVLSAVNQPSLQAHNTGSQAKPPAASQSRGSRPQSPPQQSGPSASDLKELAMQMHTVMKAVGDLKREKDEGEQKMDKKTKILARALLAFREHMKRMAEDSARTSSDLASLKDSQGKLDTQVSGLRRAQEAMYSKLAKLEQSSASVGTDVSAIKRTEEDVRQELRQLRSGQTEEERRQQQLQQTVQTAAHPDAQAEERVEHVEKNQRLLARILEAVAKDTNLMDRHLVRQDEGLEGVASSMAGKLNQQHELRSEMHDVDKEIHEIRSDIDRLIDPRSPINMDRSKGILKMKNDIVSLAEALRRTQMDMKSQKVDMMSLVKDLANVQLAAQDTKSHLYTVIKAATHLRDDVNELKKMQLQKPSVIQVAEMHKRVLVALRGLETKEDNLLDKVAEYKLLVETLAKRFQEFRTGGPEVFSVLKDFQDKMQHTAHRVDKLASYLKHIDLAVASGSPSNMKETEEKLEAKIHHIDKNIQTLRTSIIEMKGTQQAAVSKEKEAQSQLAKERLQNQMNLEKTKEADRTREERLRLELEKQKAEAEQLKLKEKQAEERARQEKEKARMLKNRHNATKGGDVTSQKRVTVAAEEESATWPAEPTDAVTWPPEMNINLTEGENAQQGQIQWKHSPEWDQLRSKTMDNWRKKWGNQAEMWREKSERWEGKSHQWQENAQVLNEGKVPVIQQERKAVEGLLAAETPRAKRAQRKAQAGQNEAKWANLLDTSGAAEKRAPRDKSSEAEVEEREAKELEAEAEQLEDEMRRLKKLQKRKRRVRRVRGLQKAKHPV